MATYTTTRTDDADRNWTTIVDLYDDNGTPGDDTDDVLLSRTYNNDDGTSFAYNYTGGVLTSTVLTDVAGAGSLYGFATRTDTFDAGGAKTSRTDVNDDGSSVVTVYNATGGVATLTTDDGAGFVRVETFNAAGIRTQIDETDGGAGAGERAWSSRIQTFDGATGDPVSVATTNDSGTTELDTYTAGVLSQTVLTDTSPSVLPFETRTTSFDATSAVTQIVTAADNGSTRTETFTAGVLSSVDIVDGADGTVDDAYDYASLTTNYDGTGAVTGRTATFDDGLTKATTYSGGVRTEMVQTDGSGDGLLRSWETSTSTFNPDGSRASVTVDRDDGVLVTTTYAGGIKDGRTVADVDDLYAFDTSTDTYEPDGDLASRTVTYDDGRTRADSYVDGVLTSRTLSDDGDLAAWTSVTTDFDPDGDITARVTSFDNGNTRTEAFDVDGNRISVTVDDAAGEKSYSEVVRSFSAAGVLEDSVSTQDNGDTVVTIYEPDGDRDARIERDGDGNDTWLFEVRDYDATGANPVVTTYDTAAELPVEYQEFFPDLFAV